MKRKNKERTGISPRPLIYLDVKAETPIDVEVHQKLGELYFINRLYDKSIQSYLIAIHLLASAHLRHQIPNENSRNTFLTNAPFTAQIGYSLIALEKKSLQVRVQAFFDLDKNLELYRSFLMNNPVKLPENFIYFCQSLGANLIDTNLKWEMLELKNTNDIRLMIRFYESLCCDENNCVA